MKPTLNSCSASPHASPRMWKALHQRGSMAVMAAISISTMVILLASIDIGYLFAQKRQLQKIADMSALAGAQQLGRSASLPNDSCAAAFAAATGNANAQATQNFPGTYTISCGRWDPTAVVVAPHYQAYPNGATPTGLPAPTAVSVVVSQSFRSFFGAWASRTVSAVAIATADAPIAVFSVGSRLLQINNGVVPGLLTALGVNINGTSLVSYNGLANVSVTPSGLLNALGFQIPLTADVGTIRAGVLANTGGCNNGFCPLSAVLGAMSSVLGQQNLASLLGLQAAQLNLQVKLITDAAGRGLFTIINTATGQSALQANINALNLLTTAIGVANGHNFGSLPLGVNIPQIINTQVQVGIVEPPSIGIGGIGATASTAQVRLFAGVQTAPGLSPLLSVNLPLVIDVVNGQGTITAMCNAKDSNGNDTATISVTAPILQVCVGNITQATAFATQGSCNANPQPPTQPFVSLLSGVLTVSRPFSVAALQNTGNVTLSKGQTQTVGSNTLQLGTTVSDLMKAVVATLLGTLLNQGPGTITNSSLASALLSTTGNVLSTTVNELNTTVQSLKNFLGNLGPGVTSLLAGSPVSGVATLLNSVGGLLNGLLSGIGNLLSNLLGNLGCTLSGHYNQCMLENQLGGNQGSGTNAISNVLLSLLGLVEQLLAPILNTLGGALATLLNNLLGINLGQVDVTLLDLKCGGGSNVRLVF